MATDVTARERLLAGNKSPISDVAAGASLASPIPTPILVNRKETNPPAAPVAVKGHACGMSNAVPDGTPLVAGSLYPAP
jgi:hypothetical protein